MADNEKTESTEGQTESKETPNEPIDVYALVAISLEQFIGVAWQKLGLHPDPLTHKIEKDLGQAKIAIDIAAKLAEILEPKLDDADKRTTQSIISDLRINFVRQSQTNA
ncbi:MAG TPA: DUF1844 domain-containing protein [Fimbriimonadales bacterium]|nr:DUF1844 domain-containing protein [Fimbriimonadales bacterium]